MVLSLTLFSINTAYNCLSILPFIGYGVLFITLPFLSTYTVIEIGAVRRGRHCYRNGWIMAETRALPSGPRTTLTKFNIFIRKLRTHTFTTVHVFERKYRAHCHSWDAYPKIAISRRSVVIVKAFNIHILMKTVLWFFVWRSDTKEIHRFFRWRSKIEISQQVCNDLLHK